MAATSNTQRTETVLPLPLPPCLSRLYRLVLPAGSDAHHTPCMLCTKYFDFPFAHSHGSGLNSPLQAILAICWGIWEPTMVVSIFTENIWTHLISHSHFVRHKHYPCLPMRKWTAERFNNLFKLDHITYKWQMVLNPDMNNSKAL